MPVAPHRPSPAWDQRLLEAKEELSKLLELYRAGQDVATGCMANDHLWEDLGLWSRRDLSELMVRNFPALAAKNDRDIKVEEVSLQAALRAGRHLPLPRSVLHGLL